MEQVAGDTHEVTVQALLENSLKLWQGP